MDQLVGLGLTHFPTLEEVRKVLERYVPSKLALAHSTVLALMISGADYGVFTALLLLLWIFGLAAFSAGTTMLKHWPVEEGKALSVSEFIEQVKAGDDTSRFLAIRGATSASAFFGFAYLIREPFVMLGLYFPFVAIVLFAAATGMAARLGYTDRLREAADADNAASADPKKVE